MKKINVCVLLISLIIIPLGCTFKQPVEELKIYYEEYEPNELQNAVIETIYRDSKYKYVMNPSKVAYIYYNGNEYSYKEALEQSIVTIDDLENAGVKIYKKERAKIIEKSCDNAETKKVYENSQYEYYVNSNCIYVMHEGKEYSIEYAVNNAIIGIDEIEELGYIENKIRK